MPARTRRKAVNLEILKHKFATTERLRYLVDNEWRTSKTAKYMPVMDPSTGKQIAEAPCCTQEEVDSAVAAAARAFPGWRDTPIPTRIQLMFRFKQLIDAHLDELTELVATENGKVLAEARGDVLKAIEVVECACSTHYLMQGDTCMNVSDGYDTVSFREPLGVFAAIAPFNFPAMIPMGWMVPFAITTGNTVVLKAASMVPQTAMRMLELLIEAGLPKGVVNLVTCSRVEADSLLVNPAIKGVCFVGSTSVGKHIYQTAAGAGKRVQALTEAKNHALVLEDCVLERTVRGIVNSTYGCAGQRCMALPVVCVQELIADEFVALLKKFAQELKIGAGLSARQPTRSGDLGGTEGIDREGDRARRRGRRQAGPRRSRRQSARLRGRLLRRPDDLRSRQARHVRRRRRNLRPGDVDQARQGFRRGLGDHERQPASPTARASTRPRAATRASSRGAPTAAWWAINVGIPVPFSGSSRSPATSSRSSATCTRSARTASPSSPRPSR